MSILDDEDFLQAIQLHLQAIAKDGYIWSQDIIEFVSQPEMQSKLEVFGAKKRSISIQTAQCWLHKMGWQYGKKRNGMYIDGYERDDVVEYRDAFIAWWKGYEKRMVTYDKDGNADNKLLGFAVPPGQAFKLILVTHDELMFYENDW